jgi:hypothetical protein
MNRDEECVAPGIWYRVAELRKNEVAFPSVIIVMCNPELNAFSVILNSYDIEASRLTEKKVTRYLQLFTFSLDAVQQYTVLYG